MRIFRSKIKWTKEGEKNSKFFLSLEKKNYTNKLISQLNVDGKIIKDKINIANAPKNFYQNLYSEKLNTKDKKYVESLNNFIQNNPMKSLSQEEKETCDQAITEKEILKSLKDLNNAKHLEHMAGQSISINIFGLT